MKQIVAFIFTSFVMLTFLTGCQAPEDGVEAGPSTSSGGDAPWSGSPLPDGGRPQAPALSWDVHQMPLAHPKGYLGGLDITYINGKLHAAFMMKVLDVAMGAEFYRLYYANNEAGYWRLWYLKSSTSRFYYYRSSNQSSNSLRIHRTRSGEPYILYIDNSNRLVNMYKENGTFYERVLIESEVASFASLLDLSNDRVHIATTPRYYNTRDIKYYAFYGSSLLDSFIYAGSISPGTSNNHLTIHLYQSRPIIFAKYYDAGIRAGRFLMIKDRSGYILANGVNAGGVFNTYWDGSNIRTCHRNVLNHRYEMTINLYNHQITTRRADFAQNYSSPAHCFVDHTSKIPFARYNLNTSYYVDLDIYSWDGLGERVADDLPFKGLRFIDKRFGIPFAGGLDYQTGRPQFLRLK